MSTKTTFKRIALVAASAMGLAVISAIPSNASVLANSLTVTAGTTQGTASTVASDTSTAGTFTVKFSATSASDTVIVSFIQDSGPTTAPLRIWGGATTETQAAIAAYGVDTSSSTGAALVKVFTDTDRANVAAPNRSDTAVITAGANSTAVSVFTFYIDTRTTRSAGTYSYRAVASAYNTGVGQGTLAQEASAIITVTVSATASQSKVASAAYSTAVISSDGTGTSDAVLAVSSTASDTPRAFINVKLRNAANGVAARESVTVTTSIGLVGVSGGTFGKSVVLAYSSDDSLTVWVKSDGGAGTASLTVSSPSVTFQNKTLTFYGAVASLVATQYANTLATGPNAGAIGVVAKDASGNISGSSTAVLIYSSSTSTISETATACSFSTTYQMHLCTLTGVAAGSATISIGTLGKAIVSPDMTVRVTGPNAATASIAFDKATYAPGEKGYIIVSAKDASGNSIAGAITSLLATGGIATTAGLTSVGGGVSTTDSMTTSSVSPTLAFSSSGYVSKEPVYAIPFYAPQTSGAIKITATGGAALPASGQVALTASAKVVNAAQDSADAALAAVTALATQVSAFITKINAQITTLTDLVMKIQKKVKA